MHAINNDEKTSDNSGRKSAANLGGARGVNSSTRRARRRGACARAQRRLHIGLLQTAQRPSKRGQEAPHSAHTPGAALSFIDSARGVPRPARFWDRSQGPLAFSWISPLSLLRVPVGPSARRFSAAPKTSSGEEFTFPPAGSALGAAAATLRRACSREGPLFGMWRRSFELLFGGGATATLRTHPTPAHAPSNPPSEDEPPCGRRPRRTSSAQPIRASPPFAAGR